MAIMAVRAVRDGKTVQTWPVGEWNPGDASERWEALVDLADDVVRQARLADAAPTEYQCWWGDEYEYEYDVGAKRFFAVGS